MLTLYPASVAGRPSAQPLHRYFLNSSSRFTWSPPRRPSEPFGRFSHLGPSFLRQRRTPQRTYHSRKAGDRKSTRLNSSHQIISYAVFCLKKKKDAHQDIAARLLKPPNPVLASVCPHGF